MDETIIKQSPVGKRLSSIPKSSLKFLFFQGKKVRLIDQMTIGRDKNNSITIDDPLVSRVHCMVRRIRSSWYIEDAGSTNGTWVNSKKITPGKAIRLNPDDTIVLGGRIKVSLI